jgi:YD repeat-containing protein
MTKNHSLKGNCCFLYWSLCLAWVLWHLNIIPMPAYADTAQYLYDELGRLVGVADSTGVTAVYNYDAVGNLTSINRFTPPGSGIGIYLEAPGSGPATTQVTLQGYASILPRPTTRSSLMGPLLRSSHLPLMQLPRLVPS